MLQGLNSVKVRIGKQQFCLAFIHSFVLSLIRSFIHSFFHALILPLLDLFFFVFNQVLATAVVAAEEAVSIIYRLTKSNICHFPRVFFPVLMYDGSINMAVLFITACSDGNRECYKWEYLCNSHDYVIKNCRKTCGRC